MSEVLDVMPEPCPVVIAPAEGPRARLMSLESAWPSATTWLEIPAGTLWVVLRRAPESWLNLECGDGRVWRLYVGRPMPLDPHERYRLQAIGAKLAQASEPSNFSRIYRHREIELLCSSERPTPGGIVRAWIYYSVLDSGNAFIVVGSSGARHVACRLAKDDGAKTAQVETFMIRDLGLIGDMVARETMPRQSSAILAGGAAAGDLVMWSETGMVYHKGSASYGWNFVGDVFFVSLALSAAVGATQVDVEILQQMEMR